MALQSEQGLTERSMQLNCHNLILALLDAPMTHVAT